MKQFAEVAPGILVIQIQIQAVCSEKDSSLYLVKSMKPITFLMEKNIVESYQFKQLKVTRTIGKMNETFNMQ